MQVFREFIIKTQISLKLKSTTICSIFLQLYSCIFYSIYIIILYLRLYILQHVLYMKQLKLLLLIGSQQVRQLLYVVCMVGVHLSEDFFPQEVGHIQLSCILANPKRFVICNNSRTHQIRQQLYFLVCKVGTKYICLSIFFLRKQGHLQFERDLQFLMISVHINFGNNCTTWYVQSEYICLTIFFVGNLNVSQIIHRDLQFLQIIVRINLFKTMMSPKQIFIDLINFFKYMLCVFVKRQKIRKRIQAQAVTNVNSWVEQFFKFVLFIFQQFVEWQTLEVHFIECLYFIFCNVILGGGFVRQNREFT
eukprot:TRINITY_DN44569_c0_g3_i2.p2 TRINITY_DN44569_c0_g3~~TRINITY_DN44569_c0_g3_i2.p2  ORF type:complete len:306 (-),score=-20.13 TRINITY_DN44569_c0_g3_i2:316-1233(-)